MNNISRHLETENMNAIPKRQVVQNMKNKGIKKKALQPLSYKAFQREWLNAVISRNTNYLVRMGNDPYTRTPSTK